MPESHAEIKGFDFTENTYTMINEKNKNKKALLGLGNTTEKSITVGKFHIGRYR